MTLKEIAEQAGVSISTVSRVLNSNDPNFASKDVRDRIWEIARKKRYSPNIAAQQLRVGAKQRTNDLPNTICSIYGYAKGAADNPYYAEIARSVKREALKFGYVVEATYSVYDAYNNHNLEEILLGTATGAVVIGRVNEEIRKELEKKFKYLVYTRLYNLDFKYDQVICNGYSATVDAIKYLYDIGHRRIGYVGAIKEEFRYKAYCEVLKTLKLPKIKESIYACPMDTKSGYKIADAIVRGEHDMPTAFFCANDILAIALIKRLTELEIKVPRDVSIISVGNTELAQYITPMLSSVEIPFYFMGKTATKLLIDRIDHGRDIATRIELPYNMIIRDSVGPPKKDNRV